MRRRRKTSQEERVCTICAQVFKKAEHLERHVRSHTKVKPFQCPMCRKSFVRQDTLLRHSRSHQSTTEMQDGQTDPPSISNQETDSTQSDRQSRQAQSGIAHNVRIDYQQSLPINKARDLSTPQSQSMPEVSMTEGDMHPLPTHIPGGMPYMSTISDTTITGAQKTLLSTLEYMNLGQNPNIASSPHEVPNYGEFDPAWASWLVGNHFDMEAVDHDILEATSNHVPSTHQGVGENTTNYAQVPDFDICDQSLSRHKNRLPSRWHTFTEPPGSGTRTPNNGLERNPDDEAYRTKLAESLRQREQIGTVPSTSFLDLCIQAYFARFQPILPIIHAPSFRPSTRNAVLLLSMCSVGSLFIGSTKATTHGISLFERLNKAILASWDHYITARLPSSIIALQAAVLGQTFGLIMGRPKDLIGIEVWHGSVVAWARKNRLFNLEESKFDVSALNDENLDSAWKDWIVREERKRLVLGIYLQDVELARLHAHEPLLRHSVTHLPHPSSSELFTAPDANTWRRLMIEHQMRNRAAAESRGHYEVPGHSMALLGAFPDTLSDFGHCMILECISALACENRDSAPDWHQTVRKCHDLLALWYEKYPASMIQRESSTSFLMMLWHMTFMSLFADFNALERACGRDGYEAAQKQRRYVKAWASSVDAKRCVIHALLIQHHFESIQLGREPFVHVPLCLYRCGLVWFCYIQHGLGISRNDDNHENDGFSPIPAMTVLTAQSALVSEVDGEGQDLNFAELQLLGIDGQKLFREGTNTLKHRRHDFSPFLRVVNLLQRLNHWGLSQRLVSTLLALVEETQDLF